MDNSKEEDKKKKPEAENRKVEKMPCMHARIFFFASNLVRMK